MNETRILGQVSIVHVGTTPPVNTILIWYDINSGVYLHKYWDIVSGDWLSFATSAVQTIMYRQDLAAVSGETTVSFRTDLPNTEYAPEILSFVDPTGKQILSGWTIPDANKTVSGFKIIPPIRYPIGNIVYRATLYV